MIEVLVCMMIMSIMSISVYRFLNGQNTSTLLSSDTIKASFIAKRGIDSLRTSDYSKIVTDCDTVDGRYARNWYVSTDINNHRKTVQLDISWISKRKHSISFNTVISDDIYKINK